MELALGTERGQRVARRFGAEDARLHVPHLLDLEVMSALRQLVGRGEVSASRAEAGWRLVSRLGPTRRWHLPLLERLWVLRDDLTPYEAAYIALAEALDATLITFDTRLAASRGHVAEVEVL